MMKGKSKAISLISGFTMIELLVVISIIGVLMALSIFGLQGAREASRDSKRKSDLVSIQSAVEIYKSDCDSYPIGSGNPTSLFGAALMGDDSNASCLSTNTYMSQVPADPISPDGNYLYSSDGTTYEICTYLEQQQSGAAVTCGGSSACGSGNCNYKVVNP